MKVRTNSIYRSFRSLLKNILLLNKNSHRMTKKADISPKQPWSFNKNSPNCEDGGVNHL